MSRDRVRAYEQGRYVGTCPGCGLVTAQLRAWSVETEGVVFVEHAACSTVYAWLLRLA